MIINNVFNNQLNAPVRSIAAKVELYNGSTLVDTFTAYDRVKSFNVERAGTDSKFIGYGICQKLNLKLIDTKRELDITTANALKVFFVAAGAEVCPLPVFYVTEVHRDELTNEISITAYDALYKAANHTVAELGLNSYTLSEFLSACADLLGVGISIAGDDDYTSSILGLNYEGGANFEGTEDIRTALAAAAEVALAVYYIDSANSLKFKQLDITGAPVLTLDKEKYITLESGINRRLSDITHATELGDNLTASIGVSGSTQYFRDNPFLELRDDAAEILDNAIALIGGLTINQFSCAWRGNCLLEIGDKIALVTKDNNTVTSYFLNDTLSYDGTLAQTTSWQYAEDEAETASNPTNLGAAINQTFAKVNKAEKRIDLVVSDVEATKESISSLQLNAEGIIASVSKLEETQAEALTGLGDEVAELNKKVEATITAEDVKIEIKSELANGVDKVTTSKGFTFNDEGLTVEKENSELKTQINEDGMRVFKADDLMLSADNTGVKAQNLHATTYLIIGNNSRFEDYTASGGARTGCFWIGG